MSDCYHGVRGRRRLFWATQPAACGTVDVCGAECGRPGLSVEGGAVAFSDYVRGLALNILMTDARKEDVTCGHRPGNRGGHWSDAYRGDGMGVGSRVRDIPPQTSMADAVKLVQAYGQADLAKLVSYGVAQSVDVKAANVGGGIVALTADIIGTTGEAARVGVSAARVENQWAWLA